MSEPSDSGDDLGQKRHFVPVEDPAEADALLREGIRSLASAILWVKEHTRVIHTHLHTIAENPKDKKKELLVWIPKDVDVAQVTVELNKLKISDYFFSVSLPQAMIFFKVRLKGIEDRGFRFEIPGRIYKVQRRKDMRFSIQDGYVVKVEFKDPLFPSKRMARNVIDLSAGGLAIFVPIDEGPLFTDGLKLKEMSFQIKGRKFNVEGEVRHKRDLRPINRRNGVKVGILFKKLKEEDRAWLSEYVMEECRKYFTQLF